VTDARWHLAPPGALDPSHPLFDLGTQAAVHHRDAWVEIVACDPAWTLPALGDALELAFERRDACALVTLAVDAMDRPLAVHARWRFPTEPLARWLGAWLAERGAIWTIVPFFGDALLDAQATGRIGWQVTTALGLPLRVATCLVRGRDLHPRRVDRKPEHDALGAIVAGLARACEEAPLRLDVEAIRVTARTRDGGLGLRLPFHPPAAPRELAQRRDATWGAIARALHDLAGSDPLRLAPWGWWDDRAAPTVHLDVFGQQGPCLGARFRRLPRTPAASRALDARVEPRVAVWDLLAPLHFDGDPGPEVSWPREPLLDVDGPLLRWGATRSNTVGPVVAVPAVPRGLEAVADDLQPERLRTPQRWIARWYDAVLDADWLEQTTSRAPEAEDASVTDALYRAFVAHGVEADPAVAARWATPVSDDAGGRGLALSLSSVAHSEGQGWDRLWAALARVDAQLPWMTVGLAVETLRVHVWYDPPSDGTPTWRPVGSAASPLP
jgi:hypothetical protein